MWISWSTVVGETVWKWYNDSRKMRRRPWVCEGCAGTQNLEDATQQVHGRKILLGVFTTRVDHELLQIYSLRDCRDMWNGYTMDGLANSPKP